METFYIFFLIEQPFLYAVFLSSEIFLVLQPNRSNFFLWLIHIVHHESGSGFGGLPAGFDLSSGSGINSLLSFGGSMILPCFQSSFACSMRSLRLETKFHQMKRSPRGSPPNSMSVVFSLASISGSALVVKTSICPA